MGFKAISYTSNIIWHFVKGKGVRDNDKEEYSFSVVSNHILKEFDKNFIGELLIQPPDTKPTHARGFYLEDAGQFKPNDENDTGEMYNLSEPRSICFADIPINHLPLHLNRYYGIGFGFRRDVIQRRIEDFKPVDYFPSKSLFTLKNACLEFQDDYGAENKLKSYAKVASADENFEEIYSEREWRTLKDFKFTADDLALILFPTKKSLELGLKHPLIKKAIESGVGYICGSDLYDQVESD